MYKYKLIQKINPADRKSPKKWYATAGPEAGAAADRL